MSAYLLPLALGATAGALAYSGAIPGVGGSPDAATRAAIARNATTREAINAATRQIADLEAAAKERAVLWAIGVAVAVILARKVLLR